MKFAEEKNATFYAVSAYNGAGINELFENIGMKCLNLTENENLKTSIKLDKKNIIYNNNNQYYCYNYYC